MRPGLRVTDRGRLARVLISAQAALSCLLLITSALCLFSLRNLLTDHPGFDRRGLTLASIKLDGSVPKESQLALWEQLRQRMSQIPQFQSAGLSSWGLFTGGGWSQTVQVPGKAPDTIETTFLKTLPGFFHAYGTKLLAGRDFRPPEGQHLPLKSAIVNQAFARRHFGGENPIGRTFYRIDTNEKPWFEVVGLVEDTRYNTLKQAAPPMVYLPGEQGDAGSMTLAVRSNLDMAAVGRS
jgi:putative ABC transport system permease protein